MAVLIIDIFGIRGNRFVVSVGRQKSGIVCERGCEGFSGREGGGEGGPLGSSFGGTESESTAVKVVATLASLFSLCLVRMSVGSLGLWDEENKKGGVN